MQINGSLQAIGAEFVRETSTAPVYHMWSINDIYPAMLRDPDKGTAILVELWLVSP